MARWLRQVIAVTLMNLRTIRGRLGSSAATVIGVGGVVAVFITVLSMAEGFRQTMAAGAARDRAIVLSKGSTSEFNSSLGRDAVRIISEAPGVARTPDGRPLASPEFFVVANVRRRSTGTNANIVMRGVEPIAFELREKFVLEEGVRFEPGFNMFIAGRAAIAEFEGLEPGSSLVFGTNEWLSMGAFAGAGSVEESELWCDVEALQSAYHRGGQYQSVRVRLESREAYREFRRTLLDDPRVNVRVLRERTYYSRQSSTLHGLITGLGTLIALLMGIGAVFGAINTMYAAVSARTREIATLRAIGFGGGAVAISVLVESCLLAALGGLLGAGIAHLFDGFTTATLNFQTFSQVAFSFAVTPTLVVAGMIFALLMGVAGGALPALRAARLPVFAALRDL
ncbi:MAG: ABC transporter permease [bacterium]|nr:ABC transporter permease [bacterium]